MKLRTAVAAPVSLLRRIARFNPPMTGRDRRLVVWTLFVLGIVVGGVEIIRGGTQITGQVLEIVVFVLVVMMLVLLDS